MGFPILKLLRSAPLVNLLAGALIAVAIVAFRATGHLQSWELAAHDWFVRHQLDEGPSESRIVLIGINEQDIHAIGHWPLTDATVAGMLGKLLQYEPRAIGVDIYRDFPVSPGHEALEALLTSYPNIIMVMKFGTDTQTSIPPPRALVDTEQVGFNDLLIDEDGIVRRGLLFMDNGERIASSFALRLAMLYLQKEGVSPQPDPSHPEHLRLGLTSFRPLEPHDGGYVGADAHGYQVLLDFKKSRSSFPAYSLTSLLSGNVPPQAIHDKIVLLGVMAESVPDVFYTPYSAGFPIDQRAMYGVLVHAHIVNQLLRAALDGERPLATLNESMETSWIIFWGMFAGAAAMLGHSVSRFAIVTASGLLILGFVGYIAFTMGWWIPVIPPALAWLVSGAFLTAYLASHEKRQRAVLMQLFSRHLSPEVAEAVWQQREQFWDGGRPRSQEMIVTVLFTDLEGYTPVSERLAPQALMDWTNTYIETMTQVVMKHGGMVDDYFGDAIKANFGVPLPRTTEREIKQDAVNAVTCALAMETEMRRLNGLWQQQQLPSARMRVGIFTGPVVAGSIGSSERLKYTTVGDAVNIAARLESFEKRHHEAGFGESPCRILIGESTRRYLPQQFHTDRVGEVAIKGKEQSVTIYLLTGRIEQEQPSL
jgi:adenylate cyclase